MINYAINSFFFILAKTTFMTSNAKSTILMKCYHSLIYKFDSLEILFIQQQVYWSSKNELQLQVLYYHCLNIAICCDVTNVKLFWSCQNVTNLESNSLFLTMKVFLFSIPFCSSCYCISTYKFTLSSRCAIIVYICEWQILKQHQNSPYSLQFLCGVYLFSVSGLYPLIMFFFYFC